jgi:hypothetical protein
VSAGAGFGMLPEIPYPGTLDAIRYGCSCPMDENIKRASLKLEPVYDPTCPVHVWVCQRREQCVHDEYYEYTEHVEQPWAVDHTITHSACEHCTVPHIECAECGKIYADWRMSAETAGWRFFVVKHHAVGPSTQPIESFWRCETCLQSR